MSENVTDFEEGFWNSFSGDKRLSNLLSHFAINYSDKIDEYIILFAEQIIGKKLIGKNLDSAKLIEFVENELSHLDIKQFKPRVKSKNKNESSDMVSESVTIYDVDRLTGVEFEKFMEELLGANGYSDAQVTGKAGDQGGDILAYKEDEKLIIQAKNYSLNRKVTNTAVQEAFGAIAYYGADKGIVVTNSFFTASARELADVNNIQLWDRIIVTQMLEGYNNPKNNPQESDSNYSSTTNSGTTHSTRYKKGSNKDTVYTTSEPRTDGSDMIKK